MDTAAAHYFHTASISIGFRTMAMKTISFKEQYEIMDYNIWWTLWCVFIPSALVARHRTPLTNLSSPPTSSCIHLRSDNNNILIVRVQGELTELWRVYGDWTRGRADSTLAGVCSSEAPLDQSRTIKLWNDLLLRMPSSTIFKLPQTLPEIMLTET